MTVRTDTIVYLLSANGKLTVADGSLLEGVTGPGTTYIPVRATNISVSVERTINPKSIPDLLIVPAQQVTIDLGEAIQTVSIQGVLVQGSPIGKVGGTEPAWVVNNRVFSRPQNSNPTMAKVGSEPNLDNLDVQIGLFLRAVGAKPRASGGYPLINKIFWGDPANDVATDLFTDSHHYLYGIDFYGTVQRATVTRAGGETQNATFTLDLFVGTRASDLVEITSTSSTMSR